MGAPDLTITVEPSESGQVLYLPLAAKTASDKPNGQLSLRLTITNNEGKTVSLDDLTISFIGPLPAVTKTIPMSTLLPVNTTELKPTQLGIWFFNTANNIILSEPAPGTIKLSLSCDGFDTPASLTMPLAVHKSSTPAGSYRFPARTSDLQPGEYWHGRGAGHSPGDLGSQLFAYDLEVMRWDAAQQEPSNLRPGTSNDLNKNHLAWDRPVYAMADGIVESFFGSMPDNTVLNKFPSPPPSPECGNSFTIRHGDEFVRYCHLQFGTLNTDLMVTGPQGNKKKVQEGEFLGLVGNSGRSPRPHLHIEATKAGALRPLPFHDVWAIDWTAFKVLDPVHPASPWVALDGLGLPNVHCAIFPVWPKLIADSDLYDVGFPVIQILFGPDRSGMAAR